MITEIEDYFAKGCGRCERFATDACSTKRWAVGLAKLRDICRAAGLTEEVKWGHPCYSHHGRNIAIMGAFLGDFRLTFFNAALMSDPEGILQRQGPNSQQPDAVRLTDNAGVAPLQAVIAAYLKEAIGYADAGIKPLKTPQDIQLPATLIEVLDTDPELAEAFHALTPGRQKSYAINLNGAKTPATQIARILKFRPRILAGKGALER